jgi:hypothetical protein
LALSIHHATLVSLSPHDGRDRDTTLAIQTKGDKPATKRHRRPQMQLIRKNLYSPKTAPAAIADVVNSYGELSSPTIRPIRKYKKRGQTKNGDVTYYSVWWRRETGTQQLNLFGGDKGSEPRFFGNYFRK